MGSNQFEDSVDASGASLADRIGRYANDDAWFDDLVEYWAEPDGVRLPIFELSDLGRKVIRDLEAGHRDVPRALLAELEVVLDDPEADPNRLAVNMWEGLDAELLDLKSRDLGSFTAVRDTLRELVGPKVAEGLAGLE